MIYRFWLAGAGLWLVPCVALADDSGLFDRLDANRDGFVASREIEKDKLRLFERLLRTSDSDGDKRLDRTEFASSLQPAPERPIGSAAMPGGGFGLEMVFTRRDRNRDGQLSKEEAPGRLQAAFDRIDANADGFLDRTEMGRAMARASSP